jgi:hypothetical protein
MQARWRFDAYTGLRNAAWAVRNSRAGLAFNPAALRLALSEAEALIGQCEEPRDVLEAFAELLTRP